MEKFSGRKPKLVVLGAAVILIVVGMYFALQPPPPTPPPPLKVLNIGIGTEPKNLDPATCGGMQTLGILKLAMETPIDCDWQTGKLLPSLVERWDQTIDATAFTLYLRKNVKFHDGTPLNATAVKYTFERLLDPAVKAGSRAGWLMIKNIEIKDAYTVIFHTDPTAFFMAKLFYAPCSIINPSQAKKLGTDFGLKELSIGTGPYKIAEYIKGKYLKLVANDQYWGGRPKIDVVYSKPVPEAATRVMALEAGELDFIFDVPPGDFARLEKNPNFQVITAAPTRVMTLYLNNLYGPLKDKRVRQALNYAIDKVAINQRILGNKGRVMDSLVPPQAFGYYHMEPYPYDPAKARQLLKEAGYPNGLELTMRYSKGRYLMDEEVVGAIQLYFADVGVKAKIENLEWATLQAKIDEGPKGDFQACYLGTGVTTLDIDQGLADWTIDGWAPKGRAPFFYNNSRINELYKEGGKTTDTEKRMKAYKEVHEIVWEDAPLVYLFFQPQLYAAKKTVHGIGVRHDETIWLNGAYIEDVGSTKAPAPKLMLLQQLMPTEKKDPV
jgi:peptide/nickel transport system substrate-binding protein